MSITYFNLTFPELSEIHLLYLWSKKATRFYYSSKFDRLAFFIIEL